MHRCLQLAQLAIGYVAPNPMVGAVLVYDNQIIGEGYHQQYGKAHAELNCIASVREEHQHLISKATLYVSLEPCSHFGKTPPCTDLIIEKKIPNVVIGCRDPFPQVDGKGIEKLKAAGIKVEAGVLEEVCKELNKRFFTFQVKKRPYVILKWAQTGDGMIGRLRGPHPNLPSTEGVGAQPLPGQETFAVGQFYEEADRTTYAKLKNFVNQHRSEPTKAEAFLWQKLRGKQLENFKFRRQHIIGNYIADFVCLSKQLVIEVDGLIHQLPEHQMSDRARTLWLNSKGYSVIRFTNDEVLFDIDDTLKKIGQALSQITPTPKKIYTVDKGSQESEERSAGSFPGGGKAGMGAVSRLYISNSYTNRLVHKWRSEEMAIVVGTNTALYDDPQLNTRLWHGKDPVRIVVDMNLRLPSSLQLFDGTIPTIVFNKQQHSLPFEKVELQTLTGVHYYQVTEHVSLVHQMLNGLYHLGIQSILVEGGAQLLQSFIDEDLWDEARVITNEKLIVGEGLPAPRIKNFETISTQSFLSDVIRIHQRKET